MYDGIFVLQIIDADVTEYELKSHPSQVYFTGKIYFKDGEEKSVGFFTFKEKDLAEKIISRTSKINHKRVLKAYFAAYNESQRLWILCYDWFDSLLDEYMNHENLEKDIMERNSHLLTFWLRDEIRYNIILISSNFYLFSHLCILLQLKSDILFLIHCAVAFYEQ